MTHDAILLAGFGGPRKPEDVVPFLRNVTAGKGIPDERLAEVGEHYQLFGGHSPINELTEALRDALAHELLAQGIDLPVIVGNRNWDPYTVDALRQVADAGGQRVLTVITSAYSSYSGCRQYREDIAAQVQSLGVPLQVEKVRAYFNTPGFVTANVDAVVAAFRESEAAGHPEADLVFVTHSIPNAMEASSVVARPASYAGQHEEVARLVSEGAGEALGRELPWRLVFCSRSGPPHVPWLEPDVNDALADMAEAGSTAVVLSPIGFITDHMEVIYDLDAEAAATARELGLGFVRAATAGTHPAFVEGLVQVVKERMGLVKPAVVGDLPAWEPVCAENCCLMPRRPDGHGGPGGLEGHGGGRGR